MSDWVPGGSRKEVEEGSRRSSYMVNCTILKRAVSHVMSASLGAMVSGEEEEEVHPPGEEQEEEEARDVLGMEEEEGDEHGCRGHRGSRSHDPSRPHGFTIGVESSPRAISCFGQLTPTL
eukprot:4399587-Amphidinium_carterae.1